MVDETQIRLEASDIASTSPSRLNLPQFSEEVFDLLWIVHFPSCSFSYHVMPPKLFVGLAKAQIQNAAALKTVRCNFPFQSAFSTCIDTKR